MEESATGTAQKKRSGQAQSPILMPKVGFTRSAFPCTVPMTVQRRRWGNPRCPIPVRSQYKCSRLVSLSPCTEMDSSSILKLCDCTNSASLYILVGLCSSGGALALQPETGAPPSTAYNALRANDCVRFYGVRLRLKLFCIRRVLVRLAVHSSQGSGVHRRRLASSYQPG